MKFINGKLSKLSASISGRQTVIIFLFFVIFTATVLPAISSLSFKLIGVSESPDTGFLFDVNLLYDIVNSYGEKGRKYYIILRWTFDIVWPIIYTIFLLTSTLYLLRKNGNKISFKIAYIPLIALSFDYLENINSTIIMAIYPTRFDLLGYLLLASSLVKWIVLSIGFVLVLLLLIQFITNSIKKTVSN